MHDVYGARSSCSSSVGRVNVSSTQHQSITAILGGTFNPPHQGHINAALSAADKIGINNVQLMPSKLPPHKQVDVSEVHRVNMIELSCQGNERLSPQLIELSLPSPSYTVKTLRALKQASNDTICFFIGADSLYNLDQWYEWEELLSYCHLIVMRRDSETFSPGPAITRWLGKNAITNKDELYTKPNGCVLLIDTPLFNVSSTALRDMLCKRSNPDKNSDESSADILNQWLPSGVIEYIDANQLYKS